METFTMYRLKVNDDLIELPEVPAKETLRFFTSAAMNYRGADVWSIGKQLQQKYGLDKIPPVYELECATGFWSLIRTALSTENGQQVEVDTKQ